jgi:hypothetical protein
VADENPQLRNPAVVERRDDGTFAGGGSANPGGQAKWLKEIRAGLRSLLPEAKNRLGEIIRSGSDKDSTAAAKVVLEYTVPKPKQTHRVEGKGGDPLALLSPEQLVEFIKGRKP